MILDWSRGEEAAALVGEMIAGGERGFGEHRSVAFVQDGEVVAGVVFHNWSPESGVLEMSLASRDKRWISRGRVTAIFDYAFAVARMVVCRMSEFDPTMPRCWEAIGGRLYMIPELRGPGEGEVIGTMTAAEWRASKWRQHG